MTTAPTPFDQVPAPVPDSTAPRAQGAHPAVYRPLQTLAAWAVSLLAVTLVLDVFTFAADADLFLALRQIAGGTAAQAELTAAELRIGVLAILQLLLFAATVPVFLVWFHRAYHNLPSLGVPSRRFGTGWAVGAWFVPFLNVVRPKQIADDIWRASVAGEHESEDSLLPVHTWWALFLLAGSVGWIAVGLAAGTEALSAAPAIADMVSRWLYVLAGIAAMVVVYRITAGQEERARQLFTADASDNDTRPSVTGAIVAAVVVAVLLVAGAGSTRPSLFADAELSADPEPNGTTVTHGAPTEPAPVAEERADELIEEEASTDDDTAPAVPEREPLQEPTTIWAGELTVGDCFDDPPEDEPEIDEVVLLPCDQPHDNEVFALVELPAGSEVPYPDEDQLGIDSEDACVEPFAGYVGIPYEQSSLWLWAIYPDAAGWRKGDRVVICVLYDGDDAKLEGSAAASGR